MDLVSVKGLLLLLLYYHCKLLFPSAQRIEVPFSLESTRQLEDEREWAVWRVFEENMRALVRLLTRYSVPGNKAKVGKDSLYRTGFKKSFVTLHLYMYMYMYPLTRESYCSYKRFVV